MLIKNSRQGFGLPSKLLHWCIAISIILLIWLGWYMVELSYYDRWYHRALSWHKSLGMIVLGLALIKIAWQLYSPAPAGSQALRAWERTAASIMHRLLLGMMLLIPISGFLISTSEGKGVAIFDWFEIPALIAKNTSVRDWAIAIHYYASYACALFVLGHAAAALKHHFIDKGDTLKRMLWK